MGKLIEEIYHDWCVELNKSSKATWTLLLDEVKKNYLKNTKSELYKSACQLANIWAPSLSFTNA